MNCAQFPNEISAGLTFKAKLTLNDYPAPAWIVTAYLRGPAVIDLVGTADGTDHEFNATAAETADYTPGRYKLTVRAAKDGEIIEVQADQVDILPDVMAAEAGDDLRSDNEKALAAIEAVIAKRASVDQERYRINNRELWRTPIAELLKLRSFYIAQVKREQNKASGRNTFGRRINVRFN